MSRYAAQTEVSVEKSKGEIERVLARYGATSFMYGWDGNRAMVQFRAQARIIRFLLPLPDREQFRRTPAGRRNRSEADVGKAWEQAQRQTWRALKLVIQANAVRLKPFNRGKICSAYTVVDVPPNEIVVWRQP